ncbi:mRNA splicing factor Cwf21 domain [Babesia duncani]|uniref:mRNA splicing factor Cwf21 domain n=1 Tax=Babesia duncani TaxID=323732 RepID=A0AAD9PMU6_9APIC|nr:mRNA splicing factor Cwf21 domain [Babesia duncani]
MFNGVGLKTPRGSGTNGYVQRSLATLPISKIVKNGDQAAILTRPRMRADPQILMHERKRKIEVKLMELRIKLEDEMTLEEIENEIAKERAILMAQLESEPLEEPKMQHNENASHSMAATKAIQLEKMERALKIQKSNRRFQKRGSSLYSSRSNSNDSSNTPVAIGALLGKNAQEAPFQDLIVGHIQHLKVQDQLRDLLQGQIAPNPQGQLVLQDQKIRQHQGLYIPNGVVIGAIHRIIKEKDHDDADILQADHHQDQGRVITARDGMTQVTVDHQAQI